MRGRIGWGLADQSLSSVTNFLAGLIVARTLGPSRFGGFTLVFATYMVALGISRALSSEPFAVRHGGRDFSQVRSQATAASGAALAVGWTAGIAVVVFGAFLGGEVGSGFLALGLLLPGLLVQDCLRYVFFAGGRGRSALLNDLVWTVLLLSFLLIMTRKGDTTVAGTVAAWGGSATIAAVFGVVQARFIPRPANAVKWFGSVRELAWRYVGEFLAYSGAAQLSLFAVGAVAGLRTVGTLRGGFLLLGPLNVVFLGVMIVAVPEGVRLVRQSGTARSALRWGALISTGLSGCALVWTLAVSQIPETIGAEFLRSTWTPARAVVIPLGLAMMGSAAGIGALVALRSLEAAAESLRARLIVSSLGVVGGVAGALTGSVSRVAAAMALAAWASAIVWWRYALRATVRHVSPVGPVDELGLVTVELGIR